MIVLQHVKPLYQTFNLLFYVILRPIYWSIIHVRTILTDWEDPGMTILLFTALFLAWWYGLVAVAILCMILYKLVRVWGTDKDISMDTIGPKRMVIEYRMARDILKYGRGALLLAQKLFSEQLLTLFAVDPLSYKIVNFELRLSRIGRALLRWEVALQRGDRRESMILLGGLSTLIVAIIALPMYQILCFVLRTVYLFLLVRVTLIVPINRRFPFLIKGMVRRVKNFLLNVVFVVRVAVFARHAKIVATERFEGDTGEKVSEEDWDRICDHIGTKVTLSRGENLGSYFEIGSSMYRLVSGEVSIITDTLGSEISSGAPTVLLQANALIGHGCVAVK